MLKVLRGVLGAVLLLAAPVAALLAGLGLLLLGVHAAAAPLAALARTGLDLLDAGVDAAGSAGVRLWASAGGWSAGRTEGAVETLVNLVDVPEKLAAVHVVALLVEAALLLGVLPLAWRAQPPEPWLRVPLRPLARRLQRWWRALGPWLRVERAVLAALVVAGSAAVAEEARAGLVGLVTRAAPAAELSWLERGGQAGGLLAAVLVLLAVGLPLLAGDTLPSGRAGRLRRALCLLTAPLLVVAALGAPW